ncbi:MAG: hypothetical protein LBC61_01405 [Candidatus Peribacteria bacterium]|nr:hypothetical protein [Candidatus Peribacteria bacterium]
MYCYYTVNGVVFDSSSPLFISASDYNNSSSSRINESSNWIKTKIEYLENTYIQES